LNVTNLAIKEVGKFTSLNINNKKHKSNFIADWLLFHLSLAMIDIDFFKSLNDVYGHQFGDLILRQLADIFKSNVRAYDVLARYGGEEFIILFPGTDRATAIVLVERIIKEVNRKDLGDHKHMVRVKVSASVVSFPEDEVTHAQKEPIKCVREISPYLFHPATIGIVDDTRDVNAPRSKRHHE